MESGGHEVGIDGGVESDDDGDDGFPRAMHASVHDRLSSMESLAGANPLMRPTNLKTRGMTVDERPCRMSFGGGESLSGGGGMRDSRSGSTALRPSMMHARSSQLEKRLNSMRSSESSSAAEASAAVEENGEEGGGGGGGSVSGGVSVSDEPGARESAAAVPTAGQWTEHIDEASGKPYWYNTDTKESTWQNPESETE